MSDLARARRRTIVAPTAGAGLESLTEVAGLVLGPILWLVAVVVVAAVIRRTWAIALALAVTVASFLVALALLAVMHARRRRQEERYEHDR